MTDISTKAIIERCDHIDHCSLNTHHQDALRMRALVAERDTLAKTLEREKADHRTALRRHGGKMRAMQQKLDQMQLACVEVGQLARNTALVEAAEKIAGQDHVDSELRRGRLQAPGVLTRAFEAILSLRSGPLDDCPECSGSGMRDSGGARPWGDYIDVPCDCGNAPHPDDAAVDRFAAAMKAKLAAKRADGRGGWDDKSQCTQQFLSDLLRGHVDKGDPVDVANFAMMLHQRGEVIAPVPEIETAPITFTYTNWRGETAQRTAVPKRIWYGSADWHPEPGWLMTAHDLEKAADRDFALADCAFAAPIQSVQEAAKVLLDHYGYEWPDAACDAIAANQGENPAYQLKMSLRALAQQDNNQ